jgi:hypothetical protein
MCVESQYTINGVTYYLYLGAFGNKLKIVTPELDESNKVLYNQSCDDPNAFKTAKARKHLAALGADVLAALMVGLIENADDIGSDDHY